MKLCSSIGRPYATKYWTDRACLKVFSGKTLIHNPPIEHYSMQKSDWQWTKCDFLFKRLNVLILQHMLKKFKRIILLLRIECNMTWLVVSLFLSLTHTQEMVGSGARFEFSLLQPKKNIINDPLSTKTWKTAHHSLMQNHPNCKVSRTYQKRAPDRARFGGERGFSTVSLFSIPHWLLPSLGHLMSEKQF
jgi:hypothetical protein